MLSNPVNSPLLRQISAALIIIVSIFLSQGCNALPEKTVFSNSKEKDSGGNYGIIEHRGIQFWLQQGERDPVDRLELVPGRYMVGFIVRRTNRGGAGMCNIEAGKRYGFEVRGRQYMPLSGVYALTGVCIPVEEEDGMEQKAQSIEERKPQTQTGSTSKKSQKK